MCSSDLVLSRGYKRKTRGEVVATPEMTARDMGDEPWQMKQKYPRVEVCVCEDRKTAILHMFERTEGERPQVLLLDDAMQHRRIQAGLNILLTDYSRLICDDKMLPAGRLREPFSGRRRAHIVIVTKCPDSLTAQEARDIERRLCLTPRQQIFFSKISYGTMRPVFGESQATLRLEELRALDAVLIIAGIAVLQALGDNMREFNSHVEMLSFPDHHDFSVADQKRMNETFGALQGTDTIAVTTEKDAARLRLCRELDTPLRQKLYTLPIETEFLLGGAERFNQIIINYVRENQRNS